MSQTKSPIQVTPGSFIHDLACVETDTVGRGTRIWPYTHVHSGAVLGERCNIGEHCYIESDVIIGDDVVVKNGVSLWDGIRIENEVIIGPNVAFTNELYPRVRPISGERSLVGITIRQGASIGANATLLPGLVIGSYSMVGAGSVVVRDVPPYTIVSGNPALLSGTICVCGKKLEFSENQATCSCGRKYIRYIRYEQEPLIVCHLEACEK